MSTEYNKQEVRTNGLTFPKAPKPELRKILLIK